MTNQATTQKRFRFSALLVLLIFWGNLNAQTHAIDGDVVEIKTQSACIAFVHKNYLKLAKLPGISITFEWSGTCVGGAAEGMGTLTQRTQSSSSTTQQTTTQRFRAGYGLGYGKLVNEFTLGDSPPVRSVGWVYSFVNRMVAFSNMGLEGRDELLSSTPILLPREGIQFVSEKGFMSSAQGVLSLYKAPCSLYSWQFSECGFAAEQANYEVWAINFIATGKDSTEELRKIKPTFCPNPKVFDSACAEQLYKQAAPLRSDILGFIQITQPAVEAQIKKMTISK